jgi:adenylate kinase
MIIALSGTPGVGKTSVSALLEKHGYIVVRLNEIALEHKFIKGFDKKRNSKVLDLEKINEFIEKTYTKENLIFVEGHAAHLLTIVDKVIILRCHPHILQKRLEQKGWKKEKIRENVEAESIDVILCEAVEFFNKEDIFEIDTTKKTIDTVESSIVEIITGNFTSLKKYNIGKIDWSEEIL